MADVSRPKPGPRDTPAPARRRASATGGPRSRRPSRTRLRRSERRGARRHERRRRAPSRASGRRPPIGPIPSICWRSRRRRACQELVPIRYGRMLVSPFTFYRGAAYPMAADLAGAPRTGLEVQLCGDAHLSNFGAFGAPDRRLIFSINDFDETLPGPVRVGREAPGGQLRRGRPRSRLRRQAATRDQSRGGARVPRGDQGLRRDAEPRPLVRPHRRRADRRARRAAREPEGAEALREEPRQGAVEGQHEGVREAHDDGRRPAQDRQRPAADRPDRGHGDRRRAG